MSPRSETEFQQLDTATPTSALRLYRQGLPEAEARVADAILADPVLVTSESVNELASRARSSTATVVRLCRRVGFDGFYRLKIALAEEVGLTRQFGHPAPTSDDATAVLESAMVSDARDIAEAVALVDRGVFEQAVDTIVKATDVLFGGVGTSGPIAQLGAVHFLALGIHAIAVQDSLAQDLTTRLLRPGSACVLVSHTGSSKETVGVAKSARSAGAKTIAVTSFARCPLAKACDLVLATGNRNDPRTLELFTTRVVHVSLLGALHAAVAARIPEEISPFDAVGEVAGRHLY